MLRDLVGSHDDLMQWMGEGQVFSLIISSDHGAACYLPILEKAGVVIHSE